MQTLAQALSRTTYPGRGSVLGRTADAAKAVILYFIMGRSENSRNRVFVEDGAGIRTQAHDPAKLADPSLIIYAPVRVAGDYTVVTNGDQTDTICDALRVCAPESTRMAFQAFNLALGRRTFEPDAPNYTPRVSGIVTVRPVLSYALNILKSADGDPGECRRYTFVYENPRPGVGHFLHTYAGDGSPLPSFEGEPERLSLGNDLEVIAKTAWDALDNDNKVSLFARSIDLTTGDTRTRVFNKHA